MQTSHDDCAPRSASDGRFLPKGVETGLTPSGAAARIKAGDQH